MTVNREKAIDRARKLMAMAADSSSPNEAAIAARRARSIMDQHQLTAGDLTEQSEFGTHTAGQPRRRAPTWEGRISVAVANLNDCIIRYNRAKQFVFQGFDDDARLCEFMLTYLVAHGLKLSRLHMKAYPEGNPGDFKTAYAAAICAKVKIIIEERAKLVIPETGQALMIVKQSMVTQEFGNTNYKTTNNRATRSSFSREAGREAGKRTNIVTGVSGSAQRRLE